MYLTGIGKLSSSRRHNVVFPAPSGPTRATLNISPRFMVSVQAHLLQLPGAARPIEVLLCEAPALYGQAVSLCLIAEQPNNFFGKIPGFVSYIEGRFLGLIDTHTCRSNGGGHDRYAHRQGFLNLVLHPGGVAQRGHKYCCLLVVWAHVIHKACDIDFGMLADAFPQSWGGVGAGDKNLNLGKR